MKKVKLKNIQNLKKNLNIIGYGAPAKLTTSLMFLVYLEKILNLSDDNNLKVTNLRRKNFLIKDFNYLK